MFVFGHLGIGRAIARPWANRHPVWVLTLGMLLPDVIDKPLYYAHLSDVVSCTRTFGHTAVLLALVLGVGAWRRSGTIAAIGVGMATHVALDCLLDGWNAEGSAWRALVWPFRGPAFAVVYTPSVAAHLARLVATPIVVAELFGIALLVWEWRGRRRTPNRS